jgi:ribonucleoside-diphosphate reductase alpha chain
MIGEVVVAGGTRRSALSSFSNLSDDRMRNAKTGNWWSITPWRSMSNNSAVYNDKQPTMDLFLSEWKALYDSKSGERGIFSRYAAKNVINRSNDFRKQHFSDKKDMRYRDDNFDFISNPCFEILLRDNEFCNLTTIVIRPSDTPDELKRKIRIATILGTFQATLTDFRFISKKWKDNTEDERLLGVSMTGIMDNKLTSGQLGMEKLKDVLTELRKTAINTNYDMAKDIGIPMATAITCIKPEGTTSAMNDSSSGIHARHASYYIRTARSDKKDPLAQLMIDQKFYHESDVMRPDHNYVFSFPMKSPKQAILRDDFDAIKQLELWLIYQMYYTEHKPSITVSVKETEWMRVGSWVYDHFEYMSGVAFLPYSDTTYQQMPFQEITEDEYKEWIKKTPLKIDWNKLSDYEKSDETTGSQELACVASGCEL